MNPRTRSKTGITRVVVCFFIVVLLVSLVVNVAVGNRWAEETPLAAAGLAVAGFLVIALTRDTFALAIGLVAAAGAAVSYFGGPVIVGWVALGLATAIEIVKVVVDTIRTRRRRTSVTSS